MRLLFFFGLTAWIGCGASLGPGLGEPCTLDSGCGEGVCNLSGTDAVCIEADGDIDGDGLANDRDFCNQQMGGAFDEDVDGLGDDCDRCPIARPPASPDADGDDVDRPCDPDPTAAGDKIAVFEGFNGPLPAGWRKLGAGSWDVVGGEVRYSGDDLSSPLTPQLTAQLPLLSDHVAVLTAYRVDQIDLASTEHLAGVTLNDNRPSPVGVGPVSTCSGRRLGTTDTLFLDTDTNTAITPFTNLFDPAGLYRLANRIDGSSAACALEAGAEQFGVNAATGGQSATEVGMFARAANVRFQYILVVQRPN